MAEERKIVGVFGSAGTQEGTPDYREAYQVGAELARSNCAVMTGGYGGTMTAASHGAAEAGGHVIGVTVGLFQQRGLVPNRYIAEEIQIPTLAERLNFLIIRPDAYVVLRGGAGTLSELSLAWNLLQVAEIPRRPLIVVGQGWRDFVNKFADISTIDSHDLRLLTLVDTADEVLPALNAWWANPPVVPVRIGDTDAAARRPASGDASQK